MTLQFSKDRKYVKINGKVYPCATTATQCNANCNAADKTIRSVACVAHPFRGATLQRCVCQAYRPRSFLEKLNSIHSLEELYGFANRRKVLGVDLPKWTEEERRMILARKYELEKSER